MHLEHITYVCKSDDLYAPQWVGRKNPPSSVGYAVQHQKQSRELKCSPITEFWMQ